MKEDMRRTAGPVVPAHSKGIKVKIERHCAEKMYGWCRAAHSEVSGPGLVRLENGVFTVYDVFLPEQECSSGWTEYGSLATGRLYNYFLQKHGLDKYMGMAGDLKFWWHTHYNFNTFWSGTDDNTAQKNTVEAGDWSLSLVINQAGDHLSRVDIISPIPVMVDKLDVELTTDSKRATKRNYASDIRKWVHPMPVRERVIIQAPKSLEVTEGYVNYAGVSMPITAYRKLMVCPCGDWTCKDCAETIEMLTRSESYV